MFAIEIEFKDQDNDHEIILVKRSFVAIGGLDTCHVVIEELRNLNYQLILVRHLGRRFKIAQLQSHLNQLQLDQLEEDFIDFDEYDSHGVIDLGPIILHIIALDMDLALKVGEPADKAGARVLREAISATHPLFPALVMKTGITVIYSFAPEMSVLVGRSRDCTLRVDSSIVSSNHARFGYEQGHFWVEDLGSTNGTFKKGSQVSGKVLLEATEQVILGRDLAITGIISADQIVYATKVKNEEYEGKPAYPVLLSVSDIVRPSRIVLVLGTPIHIGRNPSSELWIGAPHVSRRHAVIELVGDQKISVTNKSVNGIGLLDGMLQLDESIIIDTDPMILDFGGGVTVALCFNETDENTFIDNRGSIASFYNNTKKAQKASTINTYSVPHQLDDVKDGKITKDSAEPMNVNEIVNTVQSQTTLHGESMLDEVRRLRDGDNVVSRIKGLFGKFSGRS